MEEQDCTLTPPEPLLLSPAYLVAELGRLIRRVMTETFPGERLRFPHVLVLGCVAAEGPLSQRGVSERLRMDPGDVVGVVDALEEAGYVKRRRDPGDRRRYALEATEAGRLFLGARRERGAHLNEVLFAPLAPHELESFKEMIVRVLAHHDPRFGRPAPGEDAGSASE